MNYLFGLISIVSFFVILSTKIDENQKAQSLSKLIIRLIGWNIGVIVGSLAFYIFFIGDPGAGRSTVDTHTKLNISMQDTTPCFSIESFKEINAYKIREIRVTKINRKSHEKYENSWDITKNHLEKLNIPLTSIVGKEQCIPYGVKNKIFSTASKKLETDGLYFVTISGEKKTITKKEDFWDRAVGEGYFYLFKDPKTSEIDIAVLNQSQVDNWFKKMEDQNQSIEIKKDKK